MKKKLLSLLLVGVLAASTFAGCGSSSSSSKKSTTKSDGKTLTVWCWDPNFNIASMKTAAKYYKKDHSDVTIKVVETPWDDIQTALTTAGTSGDTSTLPDIVLVQDNAFKKNVNNYPDLFTNLTKSGIDYSKFASGKTAYSVVNKKNYGVPFDNGSVVAAYRTDILEQAGYTIDDLTDITWSQYETIAADVYAKTGYYLDSMQGNEPDLVMMMLQSCGASVFDDNGKAVIKDNATLKAIMTQYVDLINKKALQVTDDSWDEYIKSFNSGKVAGAINGCWIMASIQSATDQSGKWAITDMPKMDNVEGATNYSNNGGSSWAITSACKNQKLAVDFLKSTFAGSADFYNEILPKTAAIATWTPAKTGSNYTAGVDFFGGQKVYTNIMDYASKVPTNNTGVYYYEARDAIATAIQDMMNGAKVDDELATAQATVDSYYNK